MLNHNRILAFVLVIATNLVAVACGSDDGKKSDDGVDASQQDATEQEASQEETGTDAGEDTGGKDAPQEDGTGTDVEPPEEMCKGSATQIVLSATSIGGLIPPEMALVARNGAYVLVTGDCTVHCSTRDGQVFTMKFDEARVSEMFEDFEVDLFEDRQGEYEGDCFDIPSKFFSYNEKSIRLHKCADDAEWITTLQQAAEKWFDTCVKEAEPVTGDMRYTVFEKSEAFEPDYHPVEWPLDVSLESIVKDPKQNIGHVATGEQVTKLRDLRTKALNGELGPVESYLIPVIDNEKSYSLVVSDTCVLEDENGKLPF